MKSVNVTYEVIVYEDGEQIVGETCMDLAMMDEVADRLIDHGSSGVAMRVIERILTNGELLKGRHYVEGSIKCFRESRLTMA